MWLAKLSLRGGCCGGRGLVDYGFDAVDGGREWGEGEKMGRGLADGMGTGGGAEARGGGSRFQSGMWRRREAMGESVEWSVGREGFGTFEGLGEDGITACAMFALPGCW